MRRMAAIFHEHPDDPYTVTNFQDIIEKATGEKVKRNTLRVYLRRFSSMGIAKPVSVPSSDEPAFQCASKFKAFSYLEGIWQDYTPQVTPTAPPIRPSTTIEHRDNLRIQLSSSEFEAVRSRGEFTRFGRAPAYYRISTKDFSLKAWSSGKAHIFLKDDWRGALTSYLGGDVVHRIEAEIEDGNLHQGIARPPPLPVGKLFKVQEPDGTVTVLQYGRSQIEAGEFDRHGKQDSPNGNLVENWLYDETSFKTDVVNKFQAIESTLRNLPDVIGRAVADAVRKAIEETLNKKPEPEEQPYQAPSEDKEDYSYR